jgi:hypothetical protein
MRTKTVIYSGGSASVFVPLAQVRVMRGVPIGLPDYLADAFVRNNPAIWAFVESTPKPTSGMTGAKEEDKR